MLYDYHRIDGNVHAYYIVTGYKVDAVDADVEMSDPLEELEDAKKVRRRGVLVVAEEGLEGARRTFVDGGAVAVFSLQRKQLKNMAVLSLCEKEVMGKDRVEVDIKKYGTIVNEMAKRREGIKPKVEAMPAKNVIVGKAREGETEKEKEAKMEEVLNKKKAEKKEEKKEVKEEKVKPPVKNSTAKTATVPAMRQPGIWASWGNAPKKAVKEKEKEAETLKMETESEDEEDEEVEDVKPVRDTSEDIRRREERDEELRRMMEEEDDVIMTDDPVEESAPEPEPEPEQEPEPVKPESQDYVQSAGGRRRGKRKVMKKVQSRDEDGYLVTKMEAAWESFSEDEPAPPKPKVSQTTVKGNGKKGQGNIRSFFMKKE
ncbi:hypothetical protein RUND412_001308 [Rhizina undulata]